MEILVYKIKVKFAILQIVLALIGATHWIQHRVVQLKMESHVSIFFKGCLWLMTVLM
jgi:fumarate reductase subunit D